jgi:pyrroline-5-carboxylate reductase
MLENSKLAFIGAGVMAEAIIHGLLQKRILPASDITASDVRPERGKELADRYGIRFTSDNRAAVERANVVVLSVKPQTLPQVLPGLSGCVPPQALVLSIIAGARLTALSEALSHAAIVRSMPNTPGRIGRGMTVWTASASVGESQRAQAREILGALGMEVFVGNEEYLDAATAISGSGPAYVFLFMEAMVEAGTRLGFSPDVAKQLVLQTVQGAADYAGGSPMDLAQLRQQVTSPGGTTAAAIQSFEADGFRETISRAVQAAHRRSIELGKG